jgi:predicted SAM-dependent methyltransferase
MNILVMANKRYESDFRKYLMRAAVEGGGKAVHVYCWEEIVLTAAERHVATYPPFAPPALVFEEIKKHLGTAPSIVLTGLGGNSMDFAFATHDFLQDAQLVYDVYDDFRFGTRGLQRWRRMRWDRRWRRYTDWAIVLELGMQRSYPRALHLDNASHLGRLHRPADLTVDNLVYIGSIDHRVDFEWLDALAGHGVRLDIWGRIHSSAPAAEQLIAGLVARHPRVAFRGDYDNDELAGILGRYRVGVLPYKVRHPLTRHVNPDKLYHYLNSGLEVVATPIPQARRMAEYLHLAAEPDWPRLSKAIADTPRAAKWPIERYSWQHRWTQLQQAATERQRSKAVARSRSALERKDQSLTAEPSPPVAPKLRRLHLGCGTNILPGWINTDILPQPSAEFLDFSKPFPFPDECLDAVFCEHTIEHVPKETAVVMCREVFRTLCPGGVFRVVTPSLENMATLALFPSSRTATRYLTWYRKWVQNPSATLSDAINAMFYQHGHRHIYSREELSEILLNTGFCGLRTLGAGEHGNSVFAGVDSRGKVIGDEINSIEAFALEVRKPD